MTCIKTQFTEIQYFINISLFSIKNYQFVQTLKKFNVIHDYKLLKKIVYGSVQIPYILERAERPRERLI